MGDEMENICVLVEIFTLVVAWRDKKPTKTLVWIAGAPANIRTENLLNTNQERYHCTSQLGDSTK
jgi:hypothetical protein